VETEFLNIIWDYFLLEIAKFGSQFIGLHLHTNSIYNVEQNIINNKKLGKRMDIGNRTINFKKGGCEDMK
jgi:hypothetical protein